MANRSVKAGVAMCTVSIDFQDYLLPLTKGLALVDLMQHATKCDARYSGVGLDKTVWTEPDAPRIELTAVNAKQIKPKPIADDLNGDN